MAQAREEVRNQVRGAEHLTVTRKRERRKRGKKPLRSDPRLYPGTREYLFGEGEVTPSSDGRQPGARASFGMNREKSTRSLLGTRYPAGACSREPEPSLGSPLKHMPDKAHGKTKAELFEKVGAITNTVGKKP